MDPSIRLTSNGAINPIRQLATVVQANTNVWKGVSSAGVTASFDVEAEEVSDDTPTLAQPSITVQSARVFVPFSVEVGDDYPGLRQELARLISDSKDVLESSIFLSGTATPQPQGLSSASRPR